MRSAILASLLLLAAGRIASAMDLRPGPVTAQQVINGVKGNAITPSSLTVPNTVLTSTSTTSFGTELTTQYGFNLRNDGTGIGRNMSTQDAVIWYYGSPTDAIRGLTGGSERFLVNDSQFKIEQPLAVTGGSVGIGTTSPAATIDVSSGTAHMRFAMISIANGASYSLPGNFGILGQLDVVEGTNYVACSANVRGGANDVIIINSGASTCVNTDTAGKISFLSLGAAAYSIKNNTGATLSLAVRYIGFN